MKNFYRPMMLGLMLAGSAIVAGAPLASAYADVNTANLTLSKSAFKAATKAEANALKATFRAQIVAAKKDKAQLRTIKAAQKVTLAAFKADLRAEIAAYKAAHR